MLNHGVATGGLPCSRVMLRAPCRQGGLAVACLESAPVGIPWGNTGLAEACLPQHPSSPAWPSPSLHPTALFGQWCSCQATYPRGSHSPGPHSGSAHPGFLQQNCAQALPWKVHLSSSSVPQAVGVFPSTILLYKSICQLLLSVLTGSSWLNLRAQNDWSICLALQHSFTENGGGGDSRRMFDQALLKLKFVNS